MTVFLFTVLGVLCIAGMRVGKSRARSFILCMLPLHSVGVCLISPHSPVPIRLSLFSAQRKVEVSEYGLMMKSMKGMPQAIPRLPHATGSTLGLCCVGNQCRTVGADALDAASGSSIVMTGSSPGHDHFSEIQTMLAAACPSEINVVIDYL